jgi:hypothetical protein
MCEIVIIYRLCKQLAGMCKDRGRGAAGYVLLLILFWFGGEISGAIAGVVVTEGKGGMVVYVFALVGAAIGAAIVFAIVNSLPPTEAVADQDDHDLRRTEYDDNIRRRFSPQRQKDEGPKRQGEEVVPAEEMWHRKMRQKDEGPDRLEEKRPGGNKIGYQVLGVPAGTDEPERVLLSFETREEALACAQFLESGKQFVRVRVEMTPPRRQAPQSGVSEGASTQARYRPASPQDHDRGSETRKS